jgi:CPA2 family monovalent cation:H+ antiporter-2
MEEGELFREIFLVVAVALAGGALAHYLRLPVIVGYLAAGLLIGPYTPGLVGDPDRLGITADVGVAALMFALGVQFSFRELMGMGRLFVVGGSAQILLTMALGLALGPALGLDHGEALYLGALMALSSTMVALKILDSRGELRVLHGRAAVGILIVQDLAVLPLMIALPVASGAEDGGLASLGVALGKAALLLIATYVLGTRLVPWFLFWVAATNSRELFVLAVISLAVGLGAASFLVGLSPAFGAFLAGLVVSESEFSYRTLAEVLPLRDVFATVFFVAMGMLIDPAFIADNAGSVVLVATCLIVGKFLIVLVVVRAAGLRGQTPFMTALVLAQAGEFSFVLAEVGVDEGVIDSDLNSTFLAAALISIMVSALLLRLSPAIVLALRRLPGGDALLAVPVEAYHVEEPERLRRHVVICGYGASGRELAEAVERRGFRYLVVETDPFIIRELRRRETPCIYGDASQPDVLEQCRLESAQVLAVTIPELVTARLAVANARRINPDLDIVARGTGPGSHAILREAGATAVVHPEFEAGLELVRHTLHRYGVDSTQISGLLGRRRIDYYRR